MEFGYVQKFKKVTQLYNFTQEARKVKLERSNVER